MTFFLLSLALSGAPAVPAPSFKSHGVEVVAPDGWKQGGDASSVVFESTGKDASMRVGLFEKDKVGDPQDCLDQIVTKLAAAEKGSKDSYVPGAIDGQPSATQVTFTPDHKYRQRRLVGCNGKSYFLIDWIELASGGARYDKAFTKLLTNIKYQAAQPR